MKIWQVEDGMNPVPLLRIDRKKELKNEYRHVGHFYLGLETGSTVAEEVVRDSLHALKI